MLQTIHSNYIQINRTKYMSSYDSLSTRYSDLTRQLIQKDAELDEKLQKSIEADIDYVDQEIEAAKKGLKEGLRQKVETVKEGIQERKDDLRHKIDEIKKGQKDRARKEAENALNEMEEDLSNKDLESAYVDRWVANQWLKVSK
jgi:hypothetical protein